MCVCGVCLRDRSLTHDRDALNGGFPTLRFWAIERRIANSTTCVFIFRRWLGFSYDLPGGSLVSTGHAQDRSEFYMAVKLTEANTVILREVCDYAGSKT